MIRFFAWFLFAMAISAGCSRQPGKVLFVIENDQFIRAERIVNISVPDKQAVDGKALYADAVLPGWLVKAALPVDQISSGTEVTLYARVKPHWRDNKRVALTGGVWNAKAEKKAMRFIIDADHLPGGEYSTVLLGKLQVNRDPLNFYLSLDEESFAILRGVSVDQLIVASGYLPYEIPAENLHQGKLVGTVGYKDGNGVLEVPVLVDGATSAMTRAGGRFEVSGLKPGKHAVTAWLDPLDPITQTVFIEEGKTATVDFTVANVGRLPEEADRRLRQWADFHRGYPNIIAYNLWDEPSSIQACWAISLQAQALTELDSTRRTMFVQNRIYPGVVADAQTRAAQPAEPVIDVYPYKFTNSPPGNRLFKRKPLDGPMLVADIVDIYQAHRRRSSLAWTIPQAFHSKDIRNAGKPRPSSKLGVMRPNELRLQAMIALATGQRGFVWFVYNFGRAGIVDNLTFKPDPTIAVEMRQVVPMVRRIAPMLGGLKPAASGRGRSELHELASDQGRVWIKINHDVSQSIDWPIVLPQNATAEKSVYELVIQREVPIGDTVTIPPGSAAIVCSLRERPRLHKTGDELRDTVEFPVGVYMLNATQFANDQAGSRQDYYRQALTDIADIGFNTVHTSGLFGPGYDDRDFVYREAGKLHLMVIAKPRGVSELFPDHFGQRGTHYSPDGKPIRLVTAY